MLVGHWLDSSLFAQLIARAQLCVKMNQIDAELSSVARVSVSAQS